MTPKTGPSRIPLIDLARGVALIAMTIYHFTWDLEFFGFLLPATITMPGWVLFARIIASTFLFLAGVSLVLAHGNGIRWGGFRKRFAMVAASAAVISVATWFLFPDAWIFFGILHAIALFSLLGVAFLRLPFWINAMIAIAVIGVGQTWTHEFFQPDWLRWVGLAPIPPTSNDYVPLFPWFGATLLGIAAAQLGGMMNWFQRLQSVAPPKVINRPLSFIGQNSLIYYLVHQPVLLGLLWVFVQVAGPPDRTPAFNAVCVSQCSTNRDELFCRAYCSCVAEGLKTEKLFTPFYQGKVNINTNEAAQKIISVCSLKHAESENE